MEHLIPQVWFDPLATGLLLAIVLAAMGILIKGADWLVEAAAHVAYRLGISKVIVGATVVSLGTTSPEAAVSVMAAWAGQPGLALGNAVGSIIADTGLIFGLGCLISVIPADRYVLKRQGWVQFGAASLLAALCYAAFITRGDAARLGRGVGILMLALLVAYLIASVRWSRQHPFTSAPAAPKRRGAGPTLPIVLALGVVGLGLVILASRVLICSVSVLAVRWGVPQVVIAATIVALGTSLPELVVGVTSVLKGHTELLVGNVIGADVLNVLFVIGASAAAAELPIVEAGARVPRIFLYLHLPAMLIILGIFRLYIFSASSRGSFRRWYGLPLVALYVAYVVSQFLLSAGSDPVHP
jgi:cation:H+ antiporter